MIIDDFIGVHSSHTWVNRRDNNYYYDSKCCVCSIHIEQFLGKLFYANSGSILISSIFPTCSTVQMRKALE